MHTDTRAHTHASARMRAPVPAPAPTLYGKCAYTCKQVRACTAVRFFDDGLYSYGPVVMAHIVMAP